MTLPEISARSCDLEDSGAICRSVVASRRATISSPHTRGSDSGSNCALDRILGASFYREMQGRRRAILGGRRGHRSGIQRGLFQAFRSSRNTCSFAGRNRRVG